MAYTLYGISLLALIGLARNFGEAGQNLATYLQTLQQSLMDKTSDFHLILDCWPLVLFSTLCSDGLEKLRKDLFEPWDFIKKISSAISLKDLV